MTFDLNEVFATFAQMVKEPVQDAHREVMDAWLDPTAPHADAMDVMLHLHNGARQTLLMMAAHAGRLDVVDRLIERDPRVLHDVVDGATPLIWAAQGGSLECVERLLPLSDPSVRDDRGANALLAAVMAGHTTAALRLLDSATVEHAHATDRQDRCTPLMWAAKLGFVPLIAPLLKISDPMAQDLKGRNALMLAARYARASAVMALLDERCARVVTPEGDTAFTLLKNYAEPGMNRAVWFEALDQLALLEPDQDLVTRAVQRQGAAYFPCWTVRREQAALREALDGPPEDRPGVSPAHGAERSTDPLGRPHDLKGRSRPRL